LNQVQFFSANIYNNMYYKNVFCVRGLQQARLAFIRRTTRLESSPRGMIWRVCDSRIKLRRRRKNDIYYYFAVGHACGGMTWGRGCARGFIKTIARLETNNNNNICIRNSEGRKKTIKRIRQNEERKKLYSFKSYDRIIF